MTKEEEVARRNRLLDLLDYILNLGDRGDVERVENFLAEAKKLIDRKMLEDHVYPDTIERDLEEEEVSEDDEE